MMKRLHELMKWFIYITPGIIFVYAVNLEISGEDLIPAGSLWQVLMSGFLTAVITVFFGPKEGEQKMKALLGGLIHYAILSAAMIGCGCLFGWMDFDANGIIMMLISVAAVYLMAFFGYYLIDVHQADEINQKLKEKYSDKD